VHCYRVLGSLQDAEDALQDTLLAAWQGLGGFEGRASIRTWLYRIATNRCLNARRAASRRPAEEWNMPNVEPPEPTRLGEVVSLQPFPDALLEGAIDVPLGPEARYERTEAISLAFVTALQLLPPRQIAVLTLRDVPWDGPLRPHPHPHRRPDPHLHPLRQQRAPMVRLAAIAPLADTQLPSALCIAGPHRVSAP
jgi:RNA polymerase sigma factor (sigma-70 family)